ncbi:MAG: hypothetical protein WED05_03195 [Candidatus Atabeyarchaeum deiterrae]
MGREVLATAFQVIMVVLALALQIVGVFILPFHLVPFSFFETIYGYDSPLVLLPFLIAFVLTVTSVIIKIINLKKKIRINDAAILAYSTVLSLLPAWVVLWASQTEWHTDLMYVYNPQMSLLSGFYVYSAGCILLLASQALAPFLAVGHLSASDEISRWIAGNRANIIGAILLMSAGPLSLVANPASPVYSIGSFYPDSLLLTAVFPLLVSVTWLAVAVAADIFMCIHSRRHLKDSQGFKPRQLIPWMLLLMIIPVSRQYYLDLPFWQLITLVSYQSAIWIFIVGQFSTMVVAPVFVGILFAIDTKVLRSKTLEGPRVAKRS